MRKAKRVVLFSVLCVLFVWIGSNYSRITEDQSGFVRLILGTLFGLIVLFRWKKPTDGEERSAEGWHIPVLSVAGGIMVVSGLIFQVHQLEWVGLLLLSYVSLCWAFPARYSRDIAIAMFLIYWIHPMPGQIFIKLQFFMQALSVKGTEWLLHCANIRVWADGMILHTGLRALGVPEVCSGMRTAVTMLLYTLGVSVLFRFRWYVTSVFVVLGLVQVLLLNILRISFMVVWSSRMPVTWADDFLHDSLGTFLLASIVVIQIETSLWKFWSERRRSIQEAIARDEIEAPEEASVLPIYWRFVNKWSSVIIAVILIIGIASFLAFKKRATHRVVMISDVVDGLLETDLDGAEKAINEGLSYISGPKLIHDGQDLKRHLLGRQALLMVLRGRFQKALDIVNRLPGELTVEEKVLKSWALMATGFPEEAVALLEELPEHVKKQPGVAIIRAEYGARRDMPGVVRDNIVPASKLHTTIQRVRNLFPYMASRGLWSVIADCENADIPYTAFSHALIAVHANILVNRINTASTILERALETWPNEPRFLSSLHSLSMRDPGGKWEDMFAQTLLANLDELDADRLASYISFSFKMNRPDLAWLVMNVLAGQDANDPALLQAPINFSRSWFKFRKHKVGIKSRDVHSLIDLRDVYLKTRDLYPINSFWVNIPYADEIAESNYGDLRTKYVKKSIAELDKRKADGTITRRMKLSYPSVLASDAKFEEAHKMLNDLSDEYPGINQKIMIEHAKLYDRCRQWQSSYDVLKRCRINSNAVDIESELMLINALMNLNMGVCAMHVAQRARKMFPESTRIDAAIASIWAAYGFKEQAMLELQGREVLSHSPAMIQLYYESGRNAAADKLSKALGFSFKRDLKKAVVPRVIPAELTIIRQKRKLFTDEEIKVQLHHKRNKLNDSKSEFMRKLLALEIDWLSRKGSGQTADIKRWEAIADTDIERVACLNRLGVLQVKNGRYEQAEKVFARAVEIMPESAIMRRILISLSNGDVNIINKARAACPDDPDIFLANLVVRIRDDKPGKWIDHMVSVMLESKLFAAESLVRASDFLLRKKFVGPASRLAKKAVKEANGYLPAYIMGVKCAHAIGDIEWGLVCALEGADNAPDPTPFYKVVATIGATDKRMSTDVVSALEYLQDHYADNPMWAIQLGNTYFQKGDSARALSILWPAIHENLAEMDPASIMIAAEAARQQGRDGDELSILVNARVKYPEDPKLLNNLVYALSRNQETLPRAVELLPVLIEKGVKDFIVFDTIAMVYLRNGQAKQAQQYMDLALKHLDRDNYAAREIRLNSAELLISVGKYRKARQVINGIRKEQGVSQIHELRSRELLRKLDKAVSEKDALNIQDPLLNSTPD
ncbi:hypothetical protein BVX94_03825 [bacterium B17]|nr:hypothetical protein BVX94_03825 [bacterium B17]